MKMWAPVICWCCIYYIYYRPCRETLPQILSLLRFHHIICSELRECAFQNPISCDRAAGADGMLVLQPGWLELGWKITTGQVKPSGRNACGLTRAVCWGLNHFSSFYIWLVPHAGSISTFGCTKQLVCLLNDRVLSLLTSVSSKSEREKKSVLGFEGQRQQGKTVLTINSTKLYSNFNPFKPSHVKDIAHYFFAMVIHIMFSLVAN